MNIFLEEIEIEEIHPVEISEDRGLVIQPHKPLGEVIRTPELVKELAAIDGIETSARESANLHGIGKTAVNRYSNGNGFDDEDARARVLSVKNQIADVAVTKLMDTLNLLKPEDMGKPRDKIALLQSLGTLVERVTGKAGEEGKVLHLHLHSVDQKKEKDYDVIEA